MISTSAHTYAKRVKAFPFLDAFGTMKRNRTFEHRRIRAFTQLGLTQAGEGQVYHRSKIAMRNASATLLDLTPSRVTPSRSRVVDEKRNPRPSALRLPLPQ